MSPSTSASSVVLSLFSSGWLCVEARASPCITNNFLRRVDAIAVAGVERRLVASRIQAALRRVGIDGEVDGLRHRAVRMRPPADLGHRARGRGVDGDGHEAVRRESVVTKRLLDRRIL